MAVRTTRVDTSNGFTFRQKLEPDLDKCAKIGGTYLGLGISGMVLDTPDDGFVMIPWSGVSAVYHEEVEE